MNSLLFFEWPELNAALYKFNIFETSLIQTQLTFKATCAQDEEYLNKFISNAKQLAFRNHSAKENSEKMYKIIKEVLDKNV